MRPVGVVHGRSTGDAFDNAAMENFWATAKREIEFLHGPLRQFARSQLRTIIFEYTSRCSRTVNDTRRFSST